MSTVQAHTIDAFLEWEQLQTLRHEFVDGDVRAMAGAGRRHEQVAGALFNRLSAHLDGTACGVFKGDFAVRLEAANSYYYPDVHVSCDPRDTDERANLHPKLIIEVLSATTADNDVGEKRRNYLTIPALDEYVVVDPKALTATSWVRQGDTWLKRAFNAGEPLAFVSVGLTLDLADMFGRA
ncbi:MAG: Uma2 family endonuclease [Pseudomonadota bacterium]|nr:Uma2 family endonuclease [Pseudomonadota bacterium]